MANFCINKVIVTHPDKSKVRGLYNVSSGDIFTFILPPPTELYNEETLKDKQYNMEEFGADNLHDWRKNNWGNAYPPIFGCEERKISQNDEILFLDFVTKCIPAIGIFEELERQGYRVKAYFWDHCGGYCGSYIYGVVEYINYAEEAHDIPLDVDLVFGIEEYVRLYKHRSVKPEPDILKTHMFTKPCYNKAIIRHDDLDKLKGLYQLPSGDIADLRKLYSQGFYHHKGLIDSKNNLAPMGFEIEKEWINRNRNSRRPHPETIQRVLSEDGTFLMLEFETPDSPPLSIYEELEEQGYNVRAYFFSHYGRYCGSFIHGISEWYEISLDQAKIQDIPQDLDKMFGIQSFYEEFMSKYHEESPEECNNIEEKDDFDHLKLLGNNRITNDMSYFHEVAN